MRVRFQLLTVFGIFAFTVSNAVPSHAQLGGLKKLGGKIKEGTVAAVDKAKGKDEKGDDAKSNGGDEAGSEKPAAAQQSKPQKLKDGEAAVIRTQLSQNDAGAKVKAYLDAKNVDYAVNPDTGRILSDWYGERRCGPGFNRCANRAAVRITVEDGQTVIRVQVMERKREGGISAKPWNENSTSKGKETAEFAADLEAALAK